MRRLITAWCAARIALAAAIVAGASLGASTAGLAEIGTTGVAQVGGVWRRDSHVFSGLLIERDEAGVARMLVGIADGRADGHEWRWYGDGSLESIREYAIGHKVGFHRGWWPNGARRFEGGYQDDGFHGTYKAWYASGRLAEIRTYVDGRESGLQQSWTPDGVLFLNYDMRGGRRYGMVNARPCMPAGKATS